MEEPELSTFEKKILDFLKGHYNQQFAIGNQTKTETKRLSKAKNDIVSKITNSMNAFMVLSEIIRISNVTSDRASSENLNKEYIREIHSDLPVNIIKATQSFDLVGEESVLQHFKNLQRNLAQNIFSLDNVQNLLDAVFVFHPLGISSQSTGKHTIYKNTDEIKEDQYRNPHKKYYRDLAGMLVESRIKEIKKNLHPEKDKPLIDSLNLTVNMLKRLDYHVEKIDVTADHNRTHE